MQITIHRGINQIGGCITEVATENARVLIDLGQNLPDGNNTVDDNLANKTSIENLTKDVDAIFYTHYHGDHIGLFHLVPDSIQQYLGKTAKEVMLCKHKQLAYIPGRKELSDLEIAKIADMKSFEAKDKIVIKDISITPYFVSHSACDAYMFLIEVDGIRILHTGDFRGHGYFSKGLIPTIKKYILTKGNIDFLITEGTMLSRIDEEVKSEGDLRKEAIELMKNYKFVFIMCSSTDMERLATFHAANKEIGNRPFVCDDFQKDILGIFSDTAGKKVSVFDFGDPYVFRENNSKLIKWMQDKGFCMLVRATVKFDNYFSFMESQIDRDETVLIYSMWKEYIDPNSKHANNQYLKFIEKFPSIRKIHTSGHASVDCLAEVCNLVNPTLGIIPIHSEHSADYQKLPIKEKLKSKIIITSKTLNDVIIEIPEKTKNT